MFEQISEESGSRTNSDMTSVHRPSQESRGDSGPGMFRPSTHFQGEKEAHEAYMAVRVSKESGKDSDRPSWEKRGGEFSDFMS